MSNKPNPESVAKVLAAGIVPGCRVRDVRGREGVVPAVVFWDGDDLAVAFWVHSEPVLLYSQFFDRTATIIEPAPALPDTFNASAHSHLITERFPATDEQP